jgi:hypothetical protein
MVDVRGFAALGLLALDGALDSLSALFAAAAALNSVAENTIVVREADSGPDEREEVAADDGAFGSLDAGSL